MVLGRVYRQLHGCNPECPELCITYICKGHAYYGSMQVWDFQSGLLLITTMMQMFNEKSAGLTKACNQLKCIQVVEEVLSSTRVK